MSENRDRRVKDEIAMYLSSYRVLHGGRYAMTAEEKMEAFDAGIDSYFEEHPEDWEPLAEYLSRPEEEDVFGDDLKALLVPELVVSIHDYMQEELGYDWLTSERVFAYEYSF